jgi:nucleoside-diphosphate-sugar epimerase
MTRVLVTGAAGNVGIPLVRNLLADGRFEVRAADQRPLPQELADRCETVVADLRSREEARRALEGCSHVIHLAAIVGGIGNFHQKAYTLTEVNNALNNAVFGAAIDLGVERFVYASSSAVFERGEVFPTPEDYLPDCPVPLSAYGFSKLNGEMYCRAAHEQHGLPYTIVRPGNAYGPGELPEAEAGIKHVIPDLIGKVLSGQKPLRILGSGKQTRTFTHLDDTAQGIIAAMSSPAGLNDDFHIIGHEEITIAELARLIWEACGKDPAEFELEPTEQQYRFDVQRRILSNAKARRMLGWEPRISVAEGVRQTAEWMMANWTPASA